MLYFNDSEGNLRKITKINYISNDTGLPVSIRRIQDLSPEDTVRLLWSLVSSLPATGYWLDTLPWSDTVPWFDYPL